MYILVQCTKNFELRIRHSSNDELNKWITLNIKLKQSITIAQTFVLSRSIIDQCEFYNETNMIPTQAKNRKRN